VPAASWRAATADLHRHITTNRYACPEPTHPAARRALAALFATRRRPTPAR
jgi:hypothetical protein